MAGIAIQLVWVLFLTVRMPVSAHDALANYALKAKMFHMEKTIPEAFFGFPESTVAHPDYPPMLPLNMTWVYAFSGFNDTSVKLIMPFFYLAFLGIAFAQLSRMMKRKSALLVTFLLATVPQIGDYATIIHADLLLGALVGGAFGYLALYLSEGRKSDIVLSSVLMGAAFWAKNEAAVFAIALMVTLAVYISSERPGKRSNRISDMLISFGVMALVAWPWLALKASEGLVNSDLAPSRLTATRLMENVRQIPIVLDFFQQEVFGPKKWNLIWITLLAAMVLRRKKLNEGVMRYLLMFFFLGLLGYFAAYMMITGNDNLYFYANTTISRFMIHFTGPAVFILALLAKDDIEEALK
ncbi:MAG: glycosyltransferase family 39 protein [Candidatus Omnitrophica bacterium]|nr:glycosyltransferase family 39 protein [Candidatus Omnitrophota bacterium]